MNNLKKSLFGWAVLFAAFSFLIISCGKEEGDEAKPNPVVKNPEITSFEPTRAPAGEEVTITGKDFGTDKSKLRVLFAENVEAVVTSLTDTQIKVTVPATAVSGNLKVMVGDKELTTSEALSIYEVNAFLSSFFNGKEDKINFHSTTKQGTVGLRFAGIKDSKLTHFGLKSPSAGTYTMILWRSKDQAKIYKKDVLVKAGELTYIELLEPINLPKEEDYVISVFLGESKPVYEIASNSVAFPDVINNFLIKGRESTLVYTEPAYPSTSKAIYPIGSFVDFKAEVVK